MSAWLEARGESVVAAGAALRQVLALDPRGSAPPRRIIPCIRTSPASACGAAPRWRFVAIAHRLCRILSHCCATARNSTSQSSPWTRGSFRRTTVQRYRLTRAAATRG